VGQGDYFVLSILASKVVLGQYYFAFRLAAQPVWVLAANFSTVMLPALARMSDDPKRQGQAAVRAARLLSFAVLPVGMLEAIAARPLLLGLFNTKWAAAIPMVQLLSIGISLDAVSWLAGSFMAARGRFHDLLRYMLPQVPLFFVLVDLGAISHGAVGVAAAVAVFYAVSQPVYVYFAFKEIGVTKSQVAGIYLRPILYCVISGAVAVAIASLSVFNGYDLLQVAVLGTVGSLVYAALVRVWEPQVWGELESRLKGALPGRRRG
jgi:PST family polysaccharide transporter